VATVASLQVTLQFAEELVGLLRTGQNITIQRASFRSDQLQLVGAINQANLEVQQVISQRSPP
jgi:hypothetical protein